MGPQRFLKYDGRCSLVRNMSASMLLPGFMVIQKSIHLWFLHNILNLYKMKEMEISVRFMAHMETSS